ncbi:hypothetical protein CMV_023245 [Castanea mollissima]|uniref:Uncharacterized protein n=1 Tax=Castanea mollissima TaxID=60419 RepID=A0A8J4QPU1_9ROSI|nr:hypothetical protein CMV_023245 [Castanea mollissima]
MRCHYIASSVIKEIGNGTLMVEDIKEKVGLTQSPSSATSSSSWPPSAASSSSSSAGAGGDDQMRKRAG